MSSATIDTGWLLEGAVFGLLFGGWMLVLAFWHFRRSRRAGDLEQRLQMPASSNATERVLRLWHEGGQETTVVPGQERLTVRQRFDQLFRDAGISLSSPVVVTRSLGPIIIVIASLFFVTGSLLPGLVIGVALAAVLWGVLKRRINKRRALFESQFVDALDLAARSLRAGHPLVGAFQLIADEIAPPVSCVFYEICQQQSLGISLEEALHTITRKLNNEDLGLFTTAVTIQIRTGGDLADMMDRLAAVIRDRLRLSRRARVLNAQTQFSKRILLCLPFLIFAVLNLINPEYMAPLYGTSSGHYLLALAGIGLLLGTWVMNRLTVLRW